MKSYLNLILLIVFMSCQSSKEIEIKKTPFFVGTYTNEESKGIYKYEIDDKGLLTKVGLQTEIENPSYLTKTSNGKILLAVSEVDENGTGFISSYKIEPDSLKLINTSKTGGAHPCFVEVNDENEVLVANYTGGNIGLLTLNNDGELSNLLNVQQHTGKGTTPRQEAPHAHSTWFHPNKEDIISIDLGTNQLWFSKIDKSENKLVYTKQKTLNMDEGAGPRHLSFHPNKKWIYVLNELNNTISLVKELDESYSISSTISMLPEGFSEYSKGADIHISNDGKFLYASNRGHNSIAIFKVNQQGGVLELVGFEDVRGANPRNFSLSPDNKFLLVANQDSNNIICFSRDVITGKLTFISEINAPNPVCILF